MANYKIKDIALAKEGKMRIEWAESRMPVMMSLIEKYKETKPLKGQRIAGCLHVTKETAVLVKALRAAGAEISWSGCNPLSTQDDIAAALAEDGFQIYAWHGQSKEDFYWSIDESLKLKPTLTLDDGADLIFRVHSKYQDLAKDIIGGTEETTTGVHRLRAMAKAKKLLYPVVAVNDAETKWDFDNVYGTGQSSLDGILRATSVLIAGKNVVVSGYGHCGRGCAMRAKGLGANVIITEVKATAALKATLEGFTVLPMDKAAKVGDIFITATGMKDVIVKKHFLSMREGAIFCNTGHYDCEINIKDLDSIAKSKRTVRDNLEEYTLQDGKKLFLIAKGRLVNLAAAEGHPSEVMDMSFANQFLSHIMLAEKGAKMSKKVYDISPKQDQFIAKLKLKTMGYSLDKLSKEQKVYSTDYTAGT